MSTMPIRVRAVPLALLLTSVLALGACGQDGPPPAPAAPAQAVRFDGGDSDMLMRGQRAFADLRTRMLEHYDLAWEITLYRMPPGTSWDKVAAHYAAALGEEWDHDERVKERGTSGYPSRVWRDGDRAVGVALLDAEKAEADELLIVMLPDQG